MREVYQLRHKGSSAVDHAIHKVNVQGDVRTYVYTSMYTLYIHLFIVWFTVCTRVHCTPCSLHSVPAITVVSRERVGFVAITGHM